MKLVPFPEHLDSIDKSQAGEHIIIDDENQVVCNDDGSTFQVTVESHPGERVYDCEVKWNESNKTWTIV